MHRQTRVAVILAALASTALLLSGCVTTAAPPVSVPSTPAMSAADKHQLVEDCESFGLILGASFDAITASPDQAEAIGMEMMRTLSERLTSGSELSRLVQSEYETARAAVEAGRSLTEITPVDRPAVVICAEVGVSLEELTTDATFVDESRDDGAIPPGFEDVNTGLALRWIDRPACGEYLYCQQLEFFTVEQCNTGVFLEAEVMDRNGRVIGLTNFELGAIGQGRVVLATFVIEQANYSHLALVEASCW